METVEINSHRPSLQKQNVVLPGELISLNIEGSGRRRWRFSPLRVNINLLLREAATFSPYGTQKSTAAAAAANKLAQLNFFLVSHISN